MLSAIEQATCSPEAIRVIRRPSVTLDDVVLSGFNGRAKGRWREGRARALVVRRKDKLIRFCLLIYPLLHAPRTNESERERERCGVWLLADSRYYVSDKSSLHEKYVISESITASKSVKRSKKS